MKLFNRSIFPLLVCLYVIACLPGLAHAAGEVELTPGLVNPGHEEQPDWFKHSFLDLDEDIAEATQDKKRLMLFFFQDGCPYCKKLLEVNFSQRDIVEKTQKYFDVVTINIWGDREVTIGGKTYTEKNFAAALKVQYTPTLMIFNEKKKIIHRANGYYSPEKFTPMLEYAGQHMEEKMSYQAYLEKQPAQKSSGQLHKEVDNVKTPHDLSKALEKDKHLLVMFEQKNCATCDELHLDVLKKNESKEQLERFNVCVVDMWSNQEITLPNGKKRKIRDWAKDIDVRYTPSLVYFNDKGKEVFRSDAYLRSFHVQSIMDYVASDAYKEESNFQRYIERRAEHLRELGDTVDIME